MCLSTEKTLMAAFEFGELPHAHAPGYRCDCYCGTPDIGCPLVLWRSQQNPSAVLPPSFHPQLKQLLDQIVQPLLTEWQARTTASTVSCILCVQTSAMTNSCSGNRFRCRASWMWIGA